jgi:hypothetical protein
MNNLNVNGTIFVSSFYSILSMRTCGCYIYVSGYVRARSDLL